MRTERPRTQWDKRNDEAREFWPNYVYAARERCGHEADAGDSMLAAMNQYFKAMDAAIAKAIDTGCIYMRYRSSQKRPELTVLIFSDSKGKTFQRSLTMDQRLAGDRHKLDFHDGWWFRLAITSTILSEGKIKPDPRGGWIPDAVFDAVDELAETLEKDRAQNHNAPPTPHEV